MSLITRCSGGLNNLILIKKKGGKKGKGKEGKSKGKIIARLLSNKIMPNGKSNVSRIEYYEDSDKNILFSTDVFAFHFSIIIDFTHPIGFLAIIAFFFAAIIQI